MRFRMLFILALVLLVAEISFSQDFNFNIVGAGARARGMGGAFIGVADDATAASWNPAGLARLDKPEASIVGLYEIFNKKSDDIENFDDIDYSHSHFGLNFISAAFPLSVGERNLVASISFQRVMDMYEKTETDDEMEERTGGINVIAPAIGIQLTPAISLGATVNIYTGQSDYAYESDLNPSANYDYADKFSGTNFSIGGLLDLNKFRLGAVFKTAYDLDWEDDYDWQSGNWNVTLKMPSVFGIGAAFSASENLTLALDYEMRSFSNVEQIFNEDFGLYQEGDEVELEYEDVNQLRIGVEYLYPTGSNIMPLRIGFATTPSPYTDGNDDQITGINLSGGIGIIMGNINLDLSLEYNTYTWENIYEEEITDNYLRFLVSGVFHLGR